MRAGGVILAGGGATRYGGKPKGLEVVGGKRVLDHLVDAFVTALGELPLLVANAGDAATWRPELRVAVDVRPGSGALGGIYTDHDAFLPESDGRRGVEPLCAAYGPACRAAIEESLDRGDLRAVAFHRAVNVGILPLAGVRALGDPARLFFNVNTPDDLAEADALWRHGSSQ